MVTVCRMWVYNENACSSKGGLCARSEFCPEDGKMEEGLCPKQQADGVECCQKLPTNLTSCGDRGGECVPTKNCGNAPTEDAECPLGQGGTHKFPPPHLSFYHCLAFSADTSCLILAPPPLPYIPSLNTSSKMKVVLVVVVVVAVVGVGCRGFIFPQPEIEVSLRRTRRSWCESARSGMIFIHVCIALWCVTRKERKLF
ncbi:hypothetical protein O3P69_017938 [Scylla paramamosain]|uniref:Disintegrin domain-containing protein n=1 Tax=Scylla paramamosain TaxID=85552 RepID=A0AAW0THS2_SCYPA